MLRRVVFIVVGLAVLDGGLAYGLVSASPAASGNYTPAERHWQPARFS